jgi:copper chaperone NosL
VEIDSSDVCARCKMAISEKRFVAELYEADGTLHKFDEIGCMLRSGKKPAATFVADYDNRTWLDGRQAFYVESKSIQTPMSGGIIAVGDRARAEQHAAQFPGRVLTFEELWKPVS